MQNPGLETNETDLSSQSLMVCVDGCGLQTYSKPFWVFICHSLSLHSTPFSSHCQEEVFVGDKTIAAVALQ